MKISEIENTLAQYRKALGDIEIYRLSESNLKHSIDDIDLKNIIRISNESVQDHRNCNVVTHKCRTVIKNYLLLTTNI